MMARTARAMAAADAAAGSASAVDLIVGSGILLVIGQAGESQETTSLAVPFYFPPRQNHKKKIPRTLATPTGPSHIPSLTTHQLPKSIPERTHAHTYAQVFEPYPR